MYHLPLKYGNSSVKTESMRESLIDFPGDGIDVTLTSEAGVHTPASDVNGTNIRYSSVFIVQSDNQTGNSLFNRNPQFTINSDGIIANLHSYRQM